MKEKVAKRTIDANSSRSIRSQFREILKREIEEGRFRRGSRIPAERQLAEQYGISRASVREAIAELINAGILIRTAGRGTFVAEELNPKPQTLTVVRHIAFVISESIFRFVQTGYNRILTGSEDTCRQNGYHLVFKTVGEGSGAASLEQLESPSPDGCIVAGGISRESLERIRKLGIPFVLADLLIADEAPAGVSVRIDNASGARMAVQHLYDLGHREIGFIGFPGSEKYCAYWQSLEAFQIRYDPHFVEFLQVHDLQPGILAGYRAVQKMISQSRLPSSLLVTNDLVALGVTEALGVAGIRIPEQLSLIGFDDLEQKTSPSLTTVRVELADVGRLAVQTLLRMIRGESLPENQIIVPVELVVRSSTAPPASSPRELQGASVAV